MPRDTRCNHPNCEGGPCKALTDEELTPTSDDRTLAERLVAEGWMQVSAKYRHVRRWKVAPPTPEQLINPEYHNTYFGQQAMRHVRFDEMELRCAPDHVVETRTLTVREFRAFKELKNREWRALIKPVHFTR